MTKGTIGREIGWMAEKNTHSCTNSAPYLYRRSSIGVHDDLETLETDSRSRFPPRKSNAITSFLMGLAVECN
jgi:hypothetical protein